ncbi:MAG: hypothetical protein KDD76_02040 [Rickettsiales bacterium]|nr:hypothetical protein [Rickettsiales bacterium]
MRTDRKFEKVQFERLRKDWDVFFNTLHDELEDAYYGTKDAEGTFTAGTGWRNGESRPFHGLDIIVANLPIKLAAFLGVQNGQSVLTPAQAKELFDALHGALWLAHGVWLHKKNSELAQPYPETQLNPDARAEDGTPIKRIDRDRKALAALKLNASIDITAILKQRFSQIDLAA